MKFVLNAILVPVLLFVLVQRAFRNSPKPCEYNGSCGACPENN